MDQALKILRDLNSVVQSDPVSNRFFEESSQGDGGSGRTVSSIICNNYDEFSSLLFSAGIDPTIVEVFDGHALVRCDVDRKTLAKLNLNMLGLKFSFCSQGARIQVLKFVSPNNTK